VRGENVLLLGEIDLDKDDDIPVGYQQSDVATVKKMVKEMEARQKRGDKRKIEMLRREGFESEAAGEVLR
jgi:U6 snRNA-associated Sm-like protein LSm1